MARKEEEVKITRGSGNVFADLGFENPEEELAKATLVYAISKAIDEKRLTQVKIAALIGIDQPQVSKLLRGRTGGYTIERLSKILNQLGQDVEIRVRPRPAKATGPGLLFVTAAAKRARAAAKTTDPKPRQVAESKATYGAQKGAPKKPAALKKTAKKK